MKVDVIKIGKYDPTQAGKFSKYEGYCLSTSEKIDHSLTEEGCHDLAKHAPPIKEFLYHSTLLRGIQTAACLPKTENCKIIPLIELREVPFALENLLSAKEFEENGSTLVRARFVEAFVDNTLLETRQQIQDRLQNILNILRISNGEATTLISHSFLMKILESMMNDIDVFNDPNLLAQVIPSDKKTYPFGEGFSFEITTI